MKLFEASSQICCGVSLICLGLLLSCGNDDVAKQVQALKGSCAINSDCKDELICAFGRCHEQCKSSVDCPHGSRCVLGEEDDVRVCQFDDEATCEISRDCRGDQVCASDNLCRDECAEKGDCAKAQVCAAEGACAETDEVSPAGILLTPMQNAPDADAQAAISSLSDSAVSSSVPTALSSAAPSSPIASNATPTSTPNDSGMDSATDAAPPHGIVTFLRGSTDVTEAEVIDATDITEDQMWAGRLYVPASVTVRADLILAPGTDIVMGPNTQIIVQSGALLAEGTEDRPVRFYGEKGPGSWGGIQFKTSADPTSSLANLLIADAGVAGFGLKLEAPVTISNVHVVDSSGLGVQSSNFSDTSERLTIVGSKLAAAELWSVKAINNFPRGGQIAENGQDAARIEMSNQMYDGDVHFKDIGIPYVQAHSLKIIDHEFRMDPGVDYRIASDTYLNLSQISHVTDVFIEGTAEKPVIFQGEEQRPGFWRGIVVDDTVRLNSYMKHVIIRHGGIGDTNVLSVQPAITLQDITLEDNIGPLVIGSEGLADDSSGIRVRNCDCSPLSIPASVLLATADIFEFSNNTGPILVSGTSSTDSGTIRSMGLPYRFEGSFQVSNGAHWTLEPGVEFQFPFLASFAIRGAFEAVGTEDKPIRIVGAEPGVGSWYGIRVYTDAVGTSFDWTEVSDGGAEDGSCLRLDRAVDVTNSSFASCQGYGILKTAEDTSDYASANLFTDVELGEVGDLP